MDDEEFIREWTPRLKERYYEEGQIETFIRNKNGFCRNSKDYFKYHIPKIIYDLFEVAWIHNHFSIDFFTLSEDYKEIWSYFRTKGPCRLNEMEWDDNYHCYVIDITAGPFLAGIKEANSPFRYVGQEMYIDRATKLGYTDIEEIRKDWMEYHNRVGISFQNKGLLPPTMNFNSKPRKTSGRRIRLWLNTQQQV